MEQFQFCVRSLLLVCVLFAIISKRAIQLSNAPQS